MSYNDKLSLDNFKKWMEGQGPAHYKLERPVNDLVGLFVESKVDARKLMAKMTTEHADPKALAEEFEESGGKIVDIEDKHFVIETSLGTFSIHRYYVKRG